MNDFITVRELAAQLGLSRDAIFYNIRKAGLQPLKFGQNFVLSQDDAERIRLAQSQDRRLPQFRNAG